MTKHKLETELSKTTSALMKDITRIRRTAEQQARMNTLRKYQTKMLNDFIKKLLAEKRITKEELEQYNIKKEEAKKLIFKKRNRTKK